MRKRTPFFLFSPYRTATANTLPTPLQNQSAELLRRFTKMKRQKNFVERRKKKLLRRFISTVRNIIKTNRLQNREYYPWKRINPNQNNFISLHEGTKFWYKPVVSRK